MAEFKKLEDYLNRPYAFHDIDGFVYDAANRMLDYFKRNVEFAKFNHLGNSEADVRNMFDQIADRWISDEFLDINRSDECNMEKFNILTDPEINRAIKDDVFGILWNLQYLDYGY